MTTSTINFSQTYVQDEHQRVQQTLAKAVDAIPDTSTGTYKTEIRLGHVFVTSTTAGQAQQCIETIILVGGTGVTARYYTATIPFAGSVVGIVCDCQATIASAQKISIYRNGRLLTAFNVAASAPNGSITFAKDKYAFAANDTFYATVTYTTAVSSSSTASFIKLYVELGA